MYDNLNRKIFEALSKIVDKDKNTVFLLLYYSGLESILTLSIPLASSFVINSLLAHATISLLVLGSAVITVLAIVLLIQIAKSYIIEKFEQKIFVTTSAKVGKMADSIRLSNSAEQNEKQNRYMNYFFDILSVQKTFPLLVLEGAGLIIKVIVSLLLLLAFDPFLFLLGSLYFVIFLSLLFFLGRGGFKKAIERSDAKHESIYYLQNIIHQQGISSQILEQLDSYLENFLLKRRQMFKTVIRQTAFTYLMEAIIISGFFILGGLLVINGTLPVGEFVAAEVIIISIVYAIRAFIKQIDYIYDMVEGIYKIEKLSKSLENVHHE